MLPFFDVTPFVPHSSEVEKLMHSNKIEMYVTCLDKSKHLYHPLENMNNLYIQTKKDNYATCCD